MFAIVHHHQRVIRCVSGMFYLDILHGHALDHRSELEALISAVVDYHVYFHTWLPPVSASDGVELGHTHMRAGRYIPKPIKLLYETGLVFSER